MTRSQIEYILALTKWRNFGKAADACFISQSTLSAMVAKFEQQIEITIFNRKTRPISITPQGENIIKSLQSLQLEYQLLDEKINEVKGKEIGELKLACIPTVAPYLYPLILDKLSEQFKHVNFIVHEFTTENIVEQILSGNIDIGIVSTPLQHKELNERSLYLEDFLLFDCGKSSKRNKYTISDIDLDRLWLLEEGHCLRNQVGKICELRQQKKINGNLTYNCGSIYTLIEMVKMNKGVTLLPRLALTNNKHISAANLHQLNSPIPMREIGLITHKHFYKQRMLNQLSSIITKSIHTHLPQTKSKKEIFDPF